MDTADRARRWAASAVDYVGCALTRTRGRLVLWLAVLVTSASLSESGSAKLGQAGSRMAAAMIAAVALEIAGAILVWSWRRLRRRKRGEQ